MERFIGSAGILLSFFLASFGVHAQSPISQFSTIEGRLFNGSVPYDTNMDIKLELIHSSDAACVLYAEEHTAQDVSSADAEVKGRFSVRLGGGTALPGNSAANLANAFGGIDVTGDSNEDGTLDCTVNKAMLTGAGTYFDVRVSVKVSGPGVYAVLNPPVRLTSVPQALSAESVQGLRPANLIQVRDDVGFDLNQSNVENVFSATNYAKLVQLLSNTFSADYSFNNQRITNVGAPTAGTDAVNRNWTDGHVGDKAADLTGVGAGTNNGHTLIWDAGNNRWTTGVPSATDNTKLPLAGGVMTGPATFQNIFSNHITMNNQTLLMLGRYNNAQESVLGLGVGDEGRMFYNTDLDALRIWDGTQYIGFGASGSAGGDLAGTYPNPTIANDAVTSAKIVDGTIATADLADSAVTPLKLGSTGANRIAITNATNTAFDFPSCVDGEVLEWSTATGWGCGTGSMISANRIRGVNVSTLSPSPGQVLKYNGSAWEAAADTNSGGTVTLVSPGNGFLPGDITTTGTLHIDTGTSAYDIVQLDNSGLMPAVDGSQMTNLNAYRIRGTNVSATPPSSESHFLGYNGSAWVAKEPNYNDLVNGSGVWFTYQPNNTACGINEVLKWNGSVWECGTDNSGGSAVTFIATTTDLSGGPITGTGTLGVNTGTGANQILRLNGSSQIPAVDGSLLTEVNAARIRGVNVSSTSPTLNQVLQYNGSAWEAVTLTDNAGVTLVTAGSGLLGGMVTTTGTISVDAGTGPNQIVQLDGSARLPAVDGRNLTQISNIRGQNVSTTTPTTGQVLRFNSSGAWEAETLSMASSAGSQGQIQFSDGSGGFNAESDLFYDSSQNRLGIGNSSPSYPLHVGNTFSMNISAQFEGPVVIRNSDTGSPTNLVLWNGNGGNTGTAIELQGNMGGAVREGGKISSFISGGTGWNGGLAFSAGDSGSYVERMRIHLNGSVGIGTTDPTPGSILDLNGLGTGLSSLVVPRDTTANRPAGANGMIRYNTSLAKFEVYENNAWVNMVASAAGSFLPLSGGIMTGTINMNGQNLTGVNSLTGSGELTISSNGSSAINLGSSSGRSLQIRDPAGNSNYLYVVGNAGGPDVYFGADGTDTNISLNFMPKGTGDIMIEGSNGRILGMGRRTLSSGAGSALTLQAGGASTATANVAGGDLILSSGISTGNQGSKILFRTAAGGATGTADRTPGTKVAIMSYGGMSIGAATPVAGAMLDVVSTGTLSSIRVPRDTTANRPTAAQNGMIRYNTNISKFEVYQADQWESIATGNVGTGDFLADGSVPMSGNFQLGGNWLSNDGDNEGIRIGNNGNVGIGAVAPSARLDIQDTVDGTTSVSVRNFSNGTSAFASMSALNDNGHVLEMGIGSLANANYPNRTYLLSSGASGLSIIADGPSADIKLITGPNETRLLADSAGRIGVGTFSPNAAAILDVNGTGNLSAMIVPRATEAERPFTAANGMIRYNTSISKFEVYQADQWVALATGSGADNLGSHAASQNIRLNGFWLSNDGGSEGLRVDNSGNVSTSGNVGIGSTTPTSNLDIFGNSGGSIGALITNTNTSGGSAYLKLSSGTAGSNGDAFLVYDLPGARTWTTGVDADQGHSFKFNLGTAPFSGNTMMILTTGGFVGIGTTAPRGEMNALTTSTSNVFRGFTSEQISDSIHGPAFTSLKARGTPGARAVVNVGDYIGGLLGYGYTGGGTYDGYETGAQINFLARAGFSPTSRDTAILFQTVQGTTLSEKMRIEPNGQIAIGTTSPTANAILDINGTGSLSTMRVPRGTTADRSGVGSNGMIRFNTDLQKFEVYEGAWTPMLQAGGGGSYLPLNGGTLTNTLTVSNGRVDITGTNGSLNIGPGAAPVNESDITLIDTRTTSGGSTYGSYLNIQAQPPSTASTQFVGTVSRVDLQPGANGSSAGIAGEFYVAKNGNTDADRIRGLSVTAQDQSAAGGNLNAIIGLEANAIANGADPVPEITAAYANVTGGGPVTNAIGVGINLAGTSVTGTAYGLSIEPISSGSTRYGIYQKGAIDTNYFAGRVGIGTAFPLTGAHLDIQGTGALLVPRGTTADRSGIGANGMIRYNTNTAKFEVYQGSWIDMIPPAAAQSIDALSDGFYSGSANRNLGLGENSMSASPSGGDNTAVGPYALADLTTGSENVALGSYTLASITTGGSNTAVGSQALPSATGSFNTALGTAAGVSVNGSDNVIVGASAMGGAGGSGILRNTVIGSSALYAISTGDNNTVLGFSAGDNITTGSNNIILGYDIEAPSATGSNQLSIGNLIFGTGANTGSGTTVSSGRVGIMTNAPQAALDIVGTGTASALIIPRDTTAARTGVGVNGMIRYNTNISKFEAYENNQWLPMIGGDLKADGTVPMTGQFLAANGTAGTPSYSFANDPNTGFYFNGTADTINVSTGGTQRFSFTPTGFSSPTTGGPSIPSGAGTFGSPTFSFAGDTGTGFYRSAAGTITLSTTGSPRFTFDSTGLSIGNGTTPASAKLDVLGNGYFHNNSAPRVQIKGFGGGGPPALVLTRSSDVDPLDSYPASGVVLGTVDFATPGDTGARVLAQSTEAQTATAAGSRLEFQTVPNGSETLATRMTIDQSGFVGIGTTSPSARLDLTGTITATAGILTGTRFQNVFNPTASSSASVAAQEVWMTTGGVNTMTSASIAGLDFKTQHLTNVALGNAQGIIGEVNNLSTGTITNAIGISAAVTRGSGVITNAKGIVIGPVEGTNARGLEIADLDGSTSSWGIYQSGSDDENFFAGRVGIGIDPNNSLSLDVMGSARFNGSVNLMNLKEGVSAVSTATTFNNANALDTSTGIVILQANSGSFVLNCLRTGSQGQRVRIVRAIDTAVSTVTLNQGASCPTSSPIFNNFVAGAANIVSDTTGGFTAELIYLNANDALSGSSAGWWTISVKP